VLACTRPSRNTILTT